MKHVSFRSNHTIILILMMTKKRYDHLCNLLDVIVLAINSYGIIIFILIKRKWKKKLLKNVIYIYILFFTPYAKIKEYTLLWEVVSLLRHTKNKTIRYKWFKYFKVIRKIEISSANNLLYSFAKPNNQLFDNRKYDEEVL